MLDVSNFTTTVLLVAVGGLIWRWVRPSEYHRKLARIPGPRCVPLLGNSLQLSADTAVFWSQMKRFCNEYERAGIQVFKLMLGNLPLLFLYQVETMEIVLGTMKNIGKSSTYRFVKPWLQQGLLLNTGESWHSRRKILTPTFHFRILTDFLPVINEQSAVLVERLGEQCEKGSFDVFPYITQCALDIICETAMGKKIYAQKTCGNTEYVRAVYRMSQLVSVRFKQPWKWNNFIYGNTSDGQEFAACLKTLHGFTRKVIDERMDEIEKCPESISTKEDVATDKIMSSTKKRKAFLDLLIHMASEAHFSRNDIQEEVDTFMFEGHDTTASGMSWTIQQIGTHPTVQARLHEEMDTIFGDSDRPATMDDLSKMKYLECVIKETMRLFPPVPAIGRYIDEDVEVAGVKIPKGASISILIWRIHRDPKHWPNPDMFDPERFTPENSSGRNAYAYIPFSAGPRNCIGQKFALNEEKCIISAILRRYHIESAQTTEEIVPCPALIMRARNGIKIRITKRTHRDATTAEGFAK